MSTEHDETKPVPTTGDQPTTPIPRSGTGRTEDPTLVFDTFGAESGRETASRPGSAGDTRPMAVGEAGPAGDTRPMPLPETTPARTSAFATAGAGTGSGSTPAPAGSGASSTPPPPGPTSGPMAPTPARLPADEPVPPAEREIRTTLRVGTVVWGLILAIIGAGVIAIAAGARFDLELALIGLLALAGLALVVGSVVTGARRKR